MSDRQIGSGKVADVYRHNGAALKLFEAGQPRNSAFREAANLALLEGTGLPVPEVFGVDRYGDRWGLTMSLVEEECGADRWFAEPDRTTEYLREFAALHAKIHARPGSNFPELRARMAASIGRAPPLSEARRTELLACLADLPIADRLCHGDFHPWNVLGQGESATIIDWLDATCGDPAADVCRSYVLLHAVSTDLAREYVVVYLRAASFDLTDVLAWLPFVAAARLAEDAIPARENLIRWAEGGACNLSSVG
ncbi:aminoglycoside phosphotransferase family protein [Psychromarinibacter sp. C21-152]|uniref:Aminoglycoside phosphotransferase family protein n=1 Tax=Psychromarinibacter sediminicola TaxID=3033385 RepID=A0AAE3T9U2_9RHOB|nr:aminoglycoside phosphotransferase family protein [Psychromarinibacter sediminicola]MDF0602990.1 aminoglycoside phosphotransferase family protein [Psychromarinibacter sediminicola]